LNILKNQRTLITSYTGKAFWIIEGFFNDYEALKAALTEFVE